MIYSISYKIARQAAGLPCDFVKNETVSRLLRDTRPAAGGGDEAGLDQLAPAPDLRRVDFLDETDGRFVRAVCPGGGKRCGKRALPGDGKGFRLVAQPCAFP